MTREDARDGSSDFTRRGLLAAGAAGMAGLAGTLRAETGPGDGLAEGRCEDLLHTTDPAHSDKIVVVERAERIQPVIDHLAANGGGIVQLLAKKYRPQDTIKLRGRDPVILRGMLPDNIRSHHSETELSGEDIPQGKYVLRFRGKEEARQMGEPGSQADDFQVTNISINGHRPRGSGSRGPDRRVHGIRVGECQYPQILRTRVHELPGNGIKFIGTQTAQCVYVETAGCGVMGQDMHCIDVGGESVGGRYRPASVLGSVTAGVGPRGDGAPIKVRRGSRLHIKSVGRRAGTRIQDRAVPGMHVNCGELIANDISHTTNLNARAPGLLIDNGGTCRIRNSVIEKSDPNVRFESGECEFVNVLFKRAKARGNGGHGFVAADSDEARAYKFINCRSVLCKGDGFVLPRAPEWAMLALSSVGHDGLDIRGPSRGTLKVIGLEAKNTTGNISTAVFGG